MLQPKKTKFRKMQKGKMKGNAQRGHQLSFGSYGIKALEEVGAWAVEVEVVPSAVLEAITKKTNLVTCSIGSGGGGDVQFLFAEDILGDSLNPFPRHSKQYCNLIKIREEMQELRKIAFSQFNAEVKNGSFPSKQFEVSSSEEELKKLTDYLSNFQ